MNVVRFLLRRTALGFATVWAVVSGVFLLFVGTRDWYLGSILARMSRGPNTDPEDIETTRQEYLAERGLDGDLEIGRASCRERV